MTKWEHYALDLVHAGILEIDPINGFIYRISKNDMYGTPEKLKERRLISPKMAGKYLAISFNNTFTERKTKNVRVHRLVWMAYNGLIPEGMQINHINTNKMDNSLVNLELTTPKENVQHSIKHGLQWWQKNLTVSRYSKTVL